MRGDTGTERKGRGGQGGDGEEKGAQGSVFMAHGLRLTIRRRKGRLS